MKVEINGINTEVTQALEEHIEHCSDKLEKYNTNQDMILVVQLKVVSHNIFNSSVLVKGKSIFAEDETDDMYNSITSSFDKIEEILSKKKEKELSKRRQNHFTTEE